MTDTARPPLDRCPTCGKGKLEPLRKTETLVIDGKRHSVPNLMTWRCLKCGESLIHAREITRASDEIRQTYSGQLRVRLGPQLHARLAEAARDDRRSLNQELVYLLEQALKSMGHS